MSSVEYSAIKHDKNLQPTKTELLAENYSKDIVDGIIHDEDKARVNDEIASLVKGAAFDLDKALDTYDPSFPRYTISADAIEFFNLMRLVEGKDFEFNTPKAHYFMADLLLGNITDPMVFPYSEEVCKTIEIDVLRLAFMQSRALAKSTVVISFFAVYSAIKGELPNGLGKVYFYILLAASSRGGARVNALAVKAMCEDSVFLNDYFESMRFTESESEFVRKGKGPAKDRSFLIRYQGINTGVRGSRYGTRRPCCVIFDDAILNTAAAYSKIMQDNLEEVIHSDAMKALKGGGMGRVILCFTPFHYGDVNTKTVLDGSFTPSVIPLTKHFDIDGELSNGVIESTWPAMHPAKAIRAEIISARKSKKTSLFLQERMLRLSASADRLVPDECIQFCDMAPIMANLHRYNIYITTDYTTTSGEGSDFSGRATWAVSSNEDWFLLDLRLSKVGMEAQYRDTLDAAAKMRRRDRYVELGVEIDGNQSAHLYALETRMRNEGTYYTFAKQKGAPEMRKGILSRGAENGASKHERFRIASTRMLQKKVWLPEHLRGTPDMREFVLQIQGATHTNFSRSDDGPDLITQLDMIEVRYPVDSIQGADMVQVVDENGFIFERYPGSAYDSY